MENWISKKMVWVWIGVMAVAVIDCSSNRLGEYTFKSHTAAAVMATPPRAQVFTDSFYDTGGDLVSQAIRIGTTIAKGIEAAEAQRRLDAAMQRVDIPEQIRRRSLERCAAYLHFRPIPDTEDADFLFMMKISEYGIDAKSWDASVHFKIDVKVRLIDNEKSIEVWKKTIKERMPVSGSIFGLHDAAGDVMTAAALSELSEEQMVEGFRHLADYAADRVAERIQVDFVKARSGG